MFTTGALTWTGGGHVVRSPVALRPVGVAAPQEVHADASVAGSEEFEVTPGTEPMAKDAWLRSGPDSGVSVSFGGANETPRPTR